MSDSNNMWKWVAIGLIIAVTALICGYLVIKEFQDQQATFNRALADNAITTNQQLVEIRTQLAALEEAINNLDGQHSDDVARIEAALRDQQNQLDSLSNTINGQRSSINDLYSKYYDQDDRISNLECAVWGDENNCTIPENPCGPYCPYCGRYYDYYCGP